MNRSDAPGGDGPRSRLFAVLPVLVTAALVAGGLVLLATTRSGPCDDEVREGLDPRSLQHLLPGSPPAEFPSGAPTSGPHQGGVFEGGVRTEPLPPTIQVGALEAGSVLIQHRPSLPDRELARVRGLAGKNVIVAPNDGLDAAIVATAWQRRLRCRSADASRLRRFITAHSARPVPSSPHP